MTIAIPRRPIRVVACLFAAIFTPGSCGQKTASLPRLDAQAVVLAFGDSLTFGTGAPPDESYPMHPRLRITCAP